MAHNEDEEKLPQSVSLSALELRNQFKHRYNTFSSTSLKDFQSASWEAFGGDDSNNNSHSGPPVRRAASSIGMGGGETTRERHHSNTIGGDSDTPPPRAIRGRHNHSLTSAEALRLAETKNKERSALKRMKVAEEIVEVEKRYLAYLRLVVEVYLPGLEDVPMENKQAIRLILTQFETFYYYHKKFSKKLSRRIESKKWDPDSSLLGDIFVKHTKFLPSYSSFFNSYMHYQETVRKVARKSPAFHKFLEECRKNPASNKNSLESLLIMPIQQVPRYGLLLGELAKATAETHPDYANTQKALTLLKGIAADLDAKKRQAEERVEEKKDTEKDVLASNQALQKIKKPKLDTKRAHLKLKISTKDIIILNRLRNAEVVGSGVEVYTCCIGGMLCAMKIIQKGQDDERAQEKELEMLEKLPYNLNIVRYIFHDTEGEKMRVFMTRYDCNLWYILNERKKKAKGDADSPYHLKTAEIVSYALDIVRGLEFLHANNIIHRDLRTDNVWGFMQEDGLSLKNLAIGNFDSAKKLNKHQQAVTFVGSSAWMAPEVFSAMDGGSPYTFQADVWGFGMVLYELMTLSRPYEGLPSHKVTHKIINGDRPIIELNKEEFIPLMAIFEDCTELDPEKRPTPQQLKASLIEIM